MMTKLNLMVIKGKRQAPNLKKILTIPELFQKQVGVFKCPNQRYEGTFSLKTHFTCDSSYLYVVICHTCSKEHAGETGIGKTKHLRMCGIRYLEAFSFNSDVKLCDSLTHELQKKFHEKI